MGRPARTQLSQMFSGQLSYQALQGMCGMLGPGCIQKENSPSEKKFASAQMLRSDCFSAEYFVFVSVKIFDTKNPSLQPDTVRKQTVHYKGFNPGSKKPNEFWGNPFSLLYHQVTRHSLLLRKSFAIGWCSHKSKRRVTAERREGSAWNGGDWLFSQCHEVHQNGNSRPSLDTMISAPPPQTHVLGAWVLPVVLHDTG